MILRSSSGVGIPEIESGIALTECSDRIAARFVHFIEFAAGEIAVSETRSAKFVACAILDGIVIDHIQADRAVATPCVDRDRVSRA